MPRLNRRLTHELINPLVSSQRVNELVKAETVNGLVDLTGTYNPERLQLVWSGSTTGDIDVTGWAAGGYLIEFAAGSQGVIRSEIRIENDKTNTALVQVGDTSALLVQSLKFNYAGGPKQIIRQINHHSANAPAFKAITQVYKIG